MAIAFLKKKREEMETAQLLEIDTVEVCSASAGVLQRWFDGSLRQAGKTGGELVIPQLVASGIVAPSELAGLRASEMKALWPAFMECGLRRLA